MTQADGFEGPLAEYNALRVEIDMKMKSQQQIVSLQLTLVGAAFGFVVSQRVSTVFLLVVPIISYLLCGQWVSQHHGIVRVSEYIRDELDRRVPGGLGWERWLLDHPRGKRFVGRGIPLLLAFPGAGFLALTWSTARVFAEPYWLLPRLTLIVVWLIGLSVVALTTILVLEAMGHSPLRQDLIG
jgi:hypothetical protein